MGVKLRTKLFAVVMALVMVLSMSSFVFAVGEETPSSQGGNTDPAEVTSLVTWCTTTSANLTWTGNDAAKTYVVCYKVGGGKYVYKNVGSKTNYTITGLKPGGMYVFMVRALNEAGEASKYFSNMWSYRWLQTANPKATRGKGKITVKWPAVKKATNYTIEYANNSSFSGRTARTQTQLQKVISGKKGKAIYYRVRPNRKNGGRLYMGVFSSKKSSSAK